MEIVDAVAVFNWMFSDKVTPHFTQQYLWDILNATVLKTNRSHDRAIKELAEANEKLKKVPDIRLYCCVVYEFVAMETAGIRFG